MVIETQELVEILRLFGPGIVALLVLVGLLFSIGRDMTRER